jgi:hypothetical protein
LVLLVKMGVGSPFAGDRAQVLTSIVADAAKHGGLQVVLLVDRSEWTKGGNYAEAHEALPAAFKPLARATRARTHVSHLFEMAAALWPCYKRASRVLVCVGALSPALTCVACGRARLFGATPTPPVAVSPSPGGGILDRGHQPALPDQDPEAPHGAPFRRQGAGHRQVPSAPHLY